MVEAVVEVPEVLLVEVRKLVLVQDTKGQVLRV
jgi:hypothetical protein